MKLRFKRAYKKLVEFYGGWRIAFVLVGVVTIVLAATVEEFSMLLAVSVVWLMTLLLIGLQKDPLSGKVVVLEAGVTPVVGAKTDHPKTDHPPLVTIVVATFNEGAYLAQCLTSVQYQSHGLIECLVVDDASTDGSVEAALKAVSGDRRFRVIHNQRNQGLAASRNLGLAAAGGSMVTFLDGDDFLFPDAIEARVATYESAVDNGTLGGAFCNWVTVPETETPGSEPPHLPVRRNVTWLSAVDDNPLIASAPLILTTSARAVGGFNETLVTAEDFDFWSRYLRHGFALRAAPYVGVAYRQKKASMYRTTIKDHVDIQLAVYGFNFRPMTPAAEPTTPFVFTDPPAVYQQQLMRARRLCVGVTVAAHHRNTSGGDLLLKSFAEIVNPWMLWAEDWTALIDRTATRLEAYSTVAAAVRIADLRQRVESQVLPLLIDSRQGTTPR